MLFVKTYRVLASRRNSIENKFSFTIGLRADCLRTSQVNCYTFNWYSVLVGNRPRCCYLGRWIRRQEGLEIAPGLGKAVGIVAAKKQLVGPVEMAGSVRIAL